MAVYSAGEASVKITPDFRKFIEALRRDLDRVDAELGIGVTVDEASFAAFKLDLARRLAEIDARVTVQVDADTTGAAAQIEALRAAGRDFTMNVDANTTAAALQLEALRAANDTHTMNVNADTTGAAAQIAGLRGGLGVVGGSVAVAGLPMLASTLSAVGNDAKALTQNLALLPGILAGAGAGFFTLSVGLDGIKDALSDSPAKAAKAYAALGMEGRKLIDTARSYGDEWDAVKDKVQAATLVGLSEPLNKVIGNQLPVLEQGMTGLATVMNRGLISAMNELGNDRSTGALSAIFGNTSTAAGELNNAVVPIISSIRTLSTTGSTFLPQLAKSFGDAATKFDGFITKANNSGDLSRWMREGIEAGGDLLSILGNLGSSLSSLLRAGKTDGEGFLGTVDRITEGWSAFLSSAEGQSRITMFITEGREQMDRWQPILSSVGTLLKSAYDAGQAWGAVLTPVLQTISGLLQGHQGILTTVLTSWLAFRTITPILSLVQAGVGATTTRIVAMQGAMAASSATGTFSRTMTGLGALLGTGGIFGIALIGAAAGLGLLAQRHQEAANAAAEQKRKLEELKGTLDEQTGAITEQTRQAVVKNLQEGGSVENGRNVFDRANSFGYTNKEFLDAGLTDTAGRARINERLTQSILQDEAVGGNWWSLAKTQTNLSDNEIAQALAGVPEALEKYRQAAGDSGVTLAELKRQLGDTAESAATLGGELNNTNSTLGQARKNWQQGNDAMRDTWGLTEEGRRKFEELGLAVTGVPNAKMVEVRTNSPEQIQQLKDLGYQIEELPYGVVKITLDDAAAKAQIAQITKPETKLVTVNVNGQIGTAGTAAGLGQDTKGPQSADSYARDESGKRIPGGRALGGPITGGIPGRDSVPIMAMPGEHMLTTSDVDKLGGQSGVYRFRAALQAGLIQPMANGGAVYPQSALPGRASSKDLERADAEDAVDLANARRNKVYNDPASTDADKLKADREYQKAQNSLESLTKQESKSTTDSGMPEDYTAQGIGAKAGEIIATGILSFFGLENSILSSSNTYNKALNTAVDYYSGSSSSDTTAEESSTGSYSYTPKEVPLEDDSASAKSSSSSSAGSDVTYSADGGVEQWRGTFAGVLDALAKPASVWLDLGLAQMRTESGGNPKAQNNSDSNAAAGTPSKGLMQVIDPTFASYRSSLFPNDIWNPGANIAAAVLYTQARYGSPAGVWGQGRGYAAGGWVTGGVPGRDSVHARLMPQEFVVAADAAQANAPLLEAINAGKVPSLPTGFGTAATSAPNATAYNRDHSVQFNGPMNVFNPEDLVRQVDRFAEQQSMGALAAYS